MPIDEEWHGVMPMEAYDRVHDLEGDLAFDWSIGSVDEAVPLHAAVERVGKAYVYRGYYYEKGRPRPCGGSVPLLGVPLELVLSSPDGGWSFEGVQTLFYGHVHESDPTDEHQTAVIESWWTFLPEVHDERLQVTALDPPTLDAMLAVACTDDIGLRLNRISEPAEGEPLEVSVTIAAWCGDNTHGLLGEGWWTSSLPGFEPSGP